MRAAAILGPGISPEKLRLFQQTPSITWLPSLPADGRDAEVIVIFGGDGTIHRHLPQLIELQLPVLIAPCGSGNDFARALGLRNCSDALAAWLAFVSGNGSIRTVDLGVITSETSPSQSHYFCTVGGFGLDSEVARRVNRLPRFVRGHGGYAFTLPAALTGFRPFRVEASSSKSNRPRRAFLVAFANGPSYGHGMKIAPQAQLDDGQLDLCIIQDMNKLKLLTLFPSVYFGRHLALQGVESFRAQRIRLEADRLLEVYADGEFVCHTPIEASVASRVLRVIVRPGR